jgi:hypothetical protein
MGWTTRTHRDFTTSKTGRAALKASYITRRDPGAKAAYDAMRRRALSAKDAKTEIETAFEQSFHEL